MYNIINEIYNYSKKQKISFYWILLMEKLDMNKFVFLLFFLFDLNLVFDYILHYIQILLVDKSILYILIEEY